MLRQNTSAKLIALQPGRRGLAGSEASFPNIFPVKIREAAGRCASPAEQQFIFKCFLVPQWPAMRIGEDFFNMPQCFPDAVFYFTAHSRMLKEMAIHGIGAGRDWFECPEVECVFWHNRFLAWAAAAKNSFWMMLRKRSADAGVPDAQRARASALGTLAHLFGLPGEMTGHLLSTFQAGEARDLERLFHKNAHQPKPARWDHPELDMWLMEIWPYVSGYHLSYYQVWQLANLKFDHPENRVFDSVDAFSNHCKMKGLNLRLSEGARKRAGRPQETSLDLGPAPALPLGIEPIERFLIRTSQEPLPFALAGKTG